MLCGKNPVLGLDDTTVVEERYGPAIVRKFVEGPFDFAGDFDRHQALHQPLHEQSEERRWALIDSQAERHGYQDDLAFADFADCREWIICGFGENARSVSGDGVIAKDVGGDGFSIPFK